MITGGCHCRNVRFELDWPEGVDRFPARTCACTFCQKHGATWTSHPDAKLVVLVTDPQALSPYKFGTETADFHVCKTCGVPVIATSRIEGRLYAVVNVNTFEGVDPARFDRATSDFDGESFGDRLARRQSRWIADVRVLVSPA
jgi:hypothetical protein